mmetsp:Transcript_49396/g.74567  ORF Transcript_49396/g.74567 Transcript_49396/m.74567 type:complete len:876 (-) Transcript_49396:388-3015(-)
MKKIVKSDSTSGKKISLVDLNACLLHTRASTSLHIFDSRIVSARSIACDTFEDEVGYNDSMLTLTKCFGLSAATAKSRCDNSLETDAPNDFSFKNFCCHRTLISEQRRGGERGGKCVAESEDMCHCESSAHITMPKKKTWQNDDEFETLVCRDCILCYCRAFHLMYWKGQMMGELPNNTRFADPNTKCFDTNHDLPGIDTNAHSSCAFSLAAPTVKATLATTTCCHEMNGYFTEVIKPTSSITINLSNAYEMITNSSSIMLNDACSVSISRHNKYSLEVSSPLGALVLRLYLPRIMYFLSRGEEFSSSAESMLEHQDPQIADERTQSSFAVSTFAPNATIVAMRVPSLLPGQGCFSAELKLVALNYTFAQKRTESITVEARWVSRASESVLSLPALAWVMQQMMSHMPPPCVIVAVIQLAIQACLSPYLIMCCENKPRCYDAQMKGQSKIDAKDIKALGCSVGLLRSVHSLEGNKAMNGSVVKVASCLKGASLLEARSLKSSMLMSLCHLVHQRAISDRSRGGNNKNIISSSKSCFSVVFQFISDFNSRHHLTAGYESKELIQHVFLAQKCCMDSTLKIQQQSLTSAAMAGAFEVKTAEEGADSEVGIELARRSGVLDAGVGPILVELYAGDRYECTNNDMKKRGKAHHVGLPVPLSFEVPKDAIIKSKPSCEGKGSVGRLREVTAIALAWNQIHKTRSPLLYQREKTNIILNDKESGCQIGGQTWTKDGNSLAEGIPYQMYALTLRTSAASWIAHIFVILTAQTATPVHKNKSHSRALMIVTRSLCIESISRDVSKQLNLGSHIKKRKEHTPKVDIVQVECHSRLQWWACLEIAKLIQPNSNPTVAKTDLKLASDEANHLKYAGSFIQICSPAA